MIKLKAVYEDEKELGVFLRLHSGHIVKVKPALNKPAIKGPKSKHYRRYVELDIPCGKRENA